MYMYLRVVSVFTTCTTFLLFLPPLTPLPFPPSPLLLQDGVDVYQGTILLPTTQVNNVS